MDLAVFQVENVEYMRFGNEFFLYMGRVFARYLFIKNRLMVGLLSSQGIMTSASERNVLVCVSKNYFENAYSGGLYIPE